MRLALLCAVLVFSAARAQVVVKHEAAALTLESWGNTIAAADDWQADGAVRALALVRMPGAGRIGARGVIEATAGVGDDIGVGERSLLWTGALGRLEYGERQGLPDVLTGYAPNPFTFTSAEFGPASGLSLDPAGGVVSRFVDADVAARLDPLSVLGYGPSLFGDRSRKLLYVSPKHGGWLGGLSFSPEADGVPDARLTQAGLVHERYFGQTVLRAGGAWSRIDAHEPLDSLAAGVSLDLEQTWALGIAATWNPDESATPVAGWRSDAFGVTASVNFNRGAWTAGAFLQEARGRESALTERERLRAAEAGVSYRTSTKLRLFLAWYRYRLDGPGDLPSADDDLLILGARLTL